MSTTVIAPLADQQFRPTPATAGRSTVRYGIRRKLLTGFGIALLLALLVGAVNLYQLSNVSALSSRTYDDEIVPIRDLGRARAALGSIDDLLLRASVDLAGQNRSAYIAAAEREQDTFNQLVAALEQTHLSEDEKRVLPTIRADWQLYQDGADAVRRALAGGDVDGASKVYFDQLAPRFTRTNEDLSQWIALNDADAKAAADEIQATYRRGLAITIALLVVAAAISGTIGFLLARTIAETAGQVAAVARGLAHGDLGQTIDVRSNDELGLMANAFGDMIRYQQAMAAVADAIARGDLTSDVRPQSSDDVLGIAFQGMTARLREMVVQLQEGSHRLSAAASEIQAATTEQSAGATEQSAAIAETTATVDQVRASADQAVQTAVAVSETAEQATRVAGEGVQAVQDATIGMAEIRQKVQSIAENILALSEQTQQIGEIIATVNDLADQSNLLALNAAIEASRAGEHGKGFAVVATEIRSLAEQSKGATAQVKTILSDIQRATHAAVMVTEQGTKGVDAGAELIHQAGQTIDKLADVSQAATHSAHQIAAAVRQHSAGMEQIALAMRNINQATTQSLAATNDTRQAAENINDLASRLDGLVAQYQV